MQNKHDEPHAFELEARSGEESRGEWTHEAAAATFRNGDLHEPTGRVWARPLDSTRDVTIRARVDDDAWESYVLSEYQGDCLRLEAEVETDGHFQLETAACD